MNFYKKTNFYPLLFILFLAFPLNSMWFKKLSNANSIKTFKIGNSLTSKIQPTIKVFNKSIYNILAPSLNIEIAPISNISKKHEEVAVSENMCQSDAFIAALHSEKLELSILAKENGPRIAKTLKEILEKERALAKDNYVFYHAQQGGYRVLQDLTTALLSASFPTKYSSFIALRDPKIFSKVQSAQSFLSDNPPHKFDRYDEQKKIRKHLLSVNLSLFGNTTEAARVGGECSLDYFLRNESAYEQSSEKLLKKLFTNHNLPIKELHTAILMQKNMCSHGNLLQISIPKGKVDSYAYFSQPLGYPSGIKLSDIMQTYPKEITYIHAPQARIVLSSGTLRPDSGVTMHQYSLADKETISSYDKKLKALVSELVRIRKI